MNWTELLKSEIAMAYAPTYKLIDKVDDEALDWKPPSGKNWMTTGQLLLHLTTACGFCCRGFVEGDWGMPEGMDLADMAPEEMLPPAEKMPSAQSKAAAREALEADEALAVQMVEQAGEDRLASEPTPAPWDDQQPVLGQRLLAMVGHLIHHKAQLFYYLKLQGADVTTQDLYG